MGGDKCCEGTCSQQVGQVGGACTQLIPLLFLVYNSAKIEDTEGKVRAGHLRRQLSHWDQDSRHELHLHEEVTVSYTEILGV